MTSKPCPRVGDFDTSDLPKGSHPSNYLYDKEYPRPVRIHTHVSFSGQHQSLIHTSSLGKHVETLRSFMKNGYQITINRYDRDNDRLQVFIDHPDKDISIMENVSMAELNDFISDNTK